MVCHSAAVLLHPATRFHDTRPAFGQRTVGALWNPVGIHVLEVSHFEKDQGILSINKHHSKASTRLSL